MESQITAEGWAGFRQGLGKPSSSKVIDDQAGQFVSRPVYQPNRIRLFTVDGASFLDCSQDFGSWKHGGFSPQRRRAAKPQPNARPRARARMRQGKLLQPEE